MQCASIYAHTFAYDKVVALAKQNALKIQICILHSQDGKTDVIANDSGDRVTPTVVSFTDYDQVCLTIYNILAFVPNFARVVLRSVVLFKKKLCSTSHFSRRIKT